MGKAISFREFEAKNASIYNNILYAETIVSSLPKETATFLFQSPKHRQKDTTSIQN
jgi:hypothetical protein